MKTAIRVILLISLLLLIGLLNASCGITGGANIKLESVALGQLTMEGKPVSGLPSDNISLSLEVSARTILVRTDATGTTLTVSPSGETIQIKSGSVIIKGTKPDQVKVEWAPTPEK